MFDYRGSLDRYQKLLDFAGIDFDIYNLEGATQREIENYTKSLLASEFSYKCIKYDAAYITRATFCELEAYVKSLMSLKEKGSVAV